MGYSNHGDKVLTYKFAVPRVRKLTFQLQSDLMLF